MTDQPRFVPYNGHPDSAHFHYHGGPLVDAIFRLADRWQAMRNRSAAGAVSDDASELSRPIPVPISAIETLDEIQSGELMACMPVETPPTARWFKTSVLLGSAATLLLSTRSTILKEKFDRRFR